MSPALTIDDPGYFDHLADIEARHWWSLGMWQLASSWLDRALTGLRGVRVLDVGCGTGLTVARLARRDEVSEVVGLDLSLDALLHARQHHDRLLRGSVLHLPFARGRFELVTCFDVFQHVPPGADRRAVRELARVLAPGGIALVRANGRGWSREGTAYRLSELTGLLSSAGLVVRRATYANCLPSLAQEVRGRLGRRLRFDPGGPGSRPHPSGGGLSIALPPPWINRMMGSLSATEAFIAGKLRGSLPFGHSTLALAEKPAD